MTPIRTTLAAVLFAALSQAAIGAETEAPPKALGAGCRPETLTADFRERDERPESPTPKREWYKKDWNGGWGPAAETYPRVQAPAGCDPVTWKRDRIIAVARKYIGLKYRHHHIPGWDPAASLSGEARAGRGLDCSNFSSWVYNYGLGIRFTSEVEEQADGPKAPGRKLKPDEPLQPGDLMYILVENRSHVSHVVIYVDPEHIIDSHGATGGITEHTPKGWYKTHFAFTRRIIE